jgi:hypothetical protein
VARAEAALDHGPGLARPPLCSLECFACRDPGSCSASARARSFWRRCLDQHHALPYVVALARAASAAGDVRFSRTQLPHVCDRRRQTGHLFLQSGHRESSPLCGAREVSITCRISMRKCEQRGAAIRFRISRSAERPPGARRMLPLHRRSVLSPARSTTFSRSAIASMRFGKAERIAATFITRRGRFSPHP